MAVVRYTKHYQKIATPKKQSRRKTVHGKKATFLHRIIPAVCMILGLFMLGNVVLPMIGYEIFTAPSLRAGASADDGSQSLTALAPTVNAREYLLPTAKPTPRILEELDYTDLSNWFPENSLP